MSQKYFAFDPFQTTVELTADEYKQTKDLLQRCEFVVIADATPTVNGPSVPHPAGTVIRDEASYQKLVNQGVVFSIRGRLHAKIGQEFPASVGARMLEARLPIRIKDMPDKPEKTAVPAEPEAPKPPAKAAAKS